MITRTKDFTLREKKYAKTKISLSREFVNRMKSTRLSDISIKEVCRKVEGSEGTFYKYYPHKTASVNYSNKFKMIRLMWELENNKDHLDSIEMIEYAFDVISDGIKDPFQLLCLSTVGCSPLPIGVWSFVFGIGHRVPP